MITSKNIGLIVAVTIIVGVIFLVGNPFEEPPVVFESPEEGTAVGKSLPSISFSLADGTPVTSRDYEGQNLLINAWAAWCPFCIAEMPDLQSAADQFDDVTVLFVHRTKTEPFSTGQVFLDDFESKGIPITDPVLLDDDDAFYGTFFGVGMPVTLFVNKNGVIMFKKIGSMDEAEVIDNINTYFTNDAPADQPRITQEGEEIMTLPDGTLYLIDPAKFRSGGPPKDGIPSIDNPKFISAAEANAWLPDDELGLGIVYKGEARFYPFRIVVSHEIVNDEIQGDPILVTYCPLCFTGIAFLSELDGEPVEFGVSGKLFNSELVMYDRRTDSYWPQSLGKAVVGPSTGKTIQKLRTDTVFYGDWKNAQPDTKVLSRDTGFQRPALDSRSK